MQHQNEEEMMQAMIEQMQAGQLPEAMQAGGMPEQGLANDITLQKLDQTLLAASRQGFSGGVFATTAIGVVGSLVGALSGSLSKVKEWTGGSYSRTKAAGVGAVTAVSAMAGADLYKRFSHTFDADNKVIDAMGKAVSQHEVETAQAEAYIEQMMQHQTQQPAQAAPQATSTTITLNVPHADAAPTVAMHSDAPRNVVSEMRPTQAVAEAPSVARAANS